MSSRYQKPFTIPEGFPALLKAFTREILRNQPANLYDFGASYFANLCELRKTGQFDLAALIAPIGLQPVPQPTAALAANLGNLSSSELEEHILSLFIAADVDQSGFLDRAEFSAALQHAELGLSERQIREVLAEADENADGVIQYAEFVPLMVQVLEAVRAKEQAKNMMAEVEEAAREDVEHLMRHGLNPEEVQEMLLQEFRNADTDHSGYLTRAELKKSLPVAKLGLTRKDINLLMSNLDVNNDALISYEEFAPLCVHVLEERFKDEIIMNEVLQSEDKLQQVLVGAFQAEDVEQTGALPPQTLKVVLQDLSHQFLGLSTFQIAALLQQAPRNDDGQVTYLKFVPVAAAMMYSMYSTDGQRLRLQAIQQLCSMGGAEALVGRNFEELKDTLRDAFEEADVDASGQLSFSEVLEIVHQITSQGPRPLTTAEVEMLFNAMDLDQSGTVNWEEFVQFIVEMLEHVERESFILQQAMTPR